MADFGLIELTQSIEKLLQPLMIISHQTDKTDSFDYIP